MANTQSQYGFAHFGYLPGYAVDYQLTQVPIRAAYSTTIGFGDPVAKENTASAFIAQMTPTLITSNICMGIFQGCLYTPSGGGAPIYSPFWPGAQGGTVATAYIINSPGALFRVASYSAPLGSGTVGVLANFTGGAPTTTGGGFSIATLDPASVATGGTTASALPFKIVSLYPGVGNGSDPTTNYNWVIVTFNSQTYRTLGGF